MKHTFNVKFLKTSFSKKYGKVIKSVDWEFTSTLDDDRYSQYSSTFSGTTNFAKKNIDPFIPYDEVTNDHIKNWVLEQEGAEELYSLIASDAKFNINAQIVEGVIDSNLPTKQETREVKVPSGSKPENSWKGKLSLFDNLVIWKKTYPKGCSEITSFPTSEFRFYNQVSDGSWITKPYITFVQNGRFRMEHHGGNTYQIDCTMPPRLWHPAISITWTSLEENSEIVCIRNRSKDPMKQYISSRKNLAANEPLLFNSVSTETYIYVAQGYINVNSSITINAEEMYKIEQGCSASIVAPNSANIIVIDNEEDYQFSITEEEPEFIKYTKVD